MSTSGLSNTPLTVTRRTSLVWLSTETPMAGIPWAPSTTE